VRLKMAEKREVIRLVEGSDLSVRRTLEELKVNRSTFYAWGQASRSATVLESDSAAYAPAGR